MAKKNNKVKALYLGTNCVALKDNETTLLIDPYFTRPSKKALFFSRIAPDPDLVRRTLAREGIEFAEAVLITHTHMDHAMDAAETAKATGANLVGSRSAENVGLGGGLPAGRIIRAQAGAPLTFGEFTVTFIRGKHLDFPFPLKQFVGLGKEILQPLTPPARTSAWKEGGTYILHIKHPDGSLVNQGSANFIPGDLAGIRADVLIPGIGGLDSRPRAFWDQWYAECFEPVMPGRAYLTHWDDFTRPLTAPPRFLRKCADVYLFIMQKSLDSQGPPVSLMPWRKWFPLFPDA